MLPTFLFGVKNGVNKTFTIDNTGFGVVLIVHAQRLLKEVGSVPGPFEYVRADHTVTLGTAPQPTDMLFAYCQVFPAYGLTEVPIRGLQNGSNTAFTLGTAPAVGMLLFKNGFLLEQILPGGSPTTVQYLQLLTAVTLGLAPVASDKLRAFVSQPATAALSVVPATGAQDNANTRFHLGYQPPPGSEPVLFSLFDGELLQRVIERPGLHQYALLSPGEVLIGSAPAASTALQFILIGTLPLTTSPYTFTQEKLARRIGIFTSRKLDQLEAREIVSQVYGELIVTYQWSFLHTEGAITTEGLKSTGTIAVGQGSQVITGNGTNFVAGDVGKTIRVNGADYGYKVLAVDQATQRLQVDTPYADITAAGQKYMLFRHVYPLPPGVEYVFSMTGSYALREIPYSLLQNVDPTRTSTSDVPQNYAYAGRDSTGAQLIELYPIPSSPAVLRFSGIRTDALTDPRQPLKGIEPLVFNAAAAIACRVIATKDGQEKSANTWITLGETYDKKASGILERLDSLDLTRSDVAKVQGMRGDGGTYDGWYEATHDTWSEDLW